MIIQGKLHRITNVVTFLASWLQTNGHPQAGFVAWPKARINLGTDFPTGQFTGGFIPSMSMDTDTDSQGFFKFSAPELAKTPFRGRLVAYNVSSMPAPQIGIVLPPIPLFEPIYRSQPFKFADVSAAEQAQVQHIYVLQESTPNGDGMNQAALNERLAGLRQSQKLDQLSAPILSNRISASARKSGGEIKFDAFVVGSTGADLTQVIEARIGEIDIDLPGPDFIVGLCISKDDIKSQIRVGMADMSKLMSKTMIDAKNGLLAQAGAGHLASNVGISVWRTRHPQTGTTIIKLPGVPDVHVPTRSVVPDPAFGLPVKLY